MSSMRVCDASLIVDFLLDGGEKGDWAAGQIARTTALHAPHLLDLEVTSAARRRLLLGEISAQRASVALQDLMNLTITRYPATHLLGRIWALRNRLTTYDAAYVSLAEVLSLPLVTTDRRLARAGGHRAEIIGFAD